MKKNFLTIAFMMSSALLQGSHYSYNYSYNSRSHNDQSLPVIAAVVAVAAVGGVALWRATAPSDAQVLADINHVIAAKNLSKYNQTFNTSSFVANQESQLIEILTLQLGYADQYQDPVKIQQRLSYDAQELAALKDSIWFRSYFNSDVATKWNELKTAIMNIVQLQGFMEKHKNFFAGWHLYKYYLTYQSNMDCYLNSGQGDFLTFVRLQHIGHKGYPLILEVTKLLKDISWIQSLHDDLYPQLKYNLNQLRQSFIDKLVVALQYHPEYDRERNLQRQDDEEQRRDDLVKAQLLQAQAQARQADAANKQADIAARNLEIERQRLELEKQENERARINARIEELRRYGYSDYEIQQTLNREGFTRAIIDLIFGTR